MKRKIINSILTAGIVMSLVGCITGNQSASSGETEEHTSYNVAENTETASGEDAEEQHRLRQMER